MLRVKQYNFKMSTPSNPITNVNNLKITDPLQDENPTSLLTYEPETGHVKKALVSDLIEVTEDFFNSRVYANLNLTENPTVEINTTTWDGFPEMHFNNHTGKIILTHKQGVAHQGAGESGVRISTDGGETFGAFTSLINEPGKYNGLSGGGVTPTGRIILFYFVATTAVGTDEIGYIYSDDDALTWSEKIPLSSGGDAQGAFTGKMLTIGGGKLMQCRWGAPEGSDYTTWNTKIYAIFSEDNGDTWGDEVIVASGSYATNNAYTESSFVYLEGGNIVGLIRKERQDYYQQFKSEDNGATWTDQGQAMFESFYTYPAKPELNTYTDIDGKRTVILYYSNRIDLWVRSIIGRDLLAGTSGWILNSKTNIAQNFDGDSGYPSAIHPNNSIYGLGVYYEAKSLSDADIRFFKSRPVNNTLIPNFLVSSDRALIKGGGTTDVAVYMGPAQTIGDAIMIAAVNNALTANKDLELRALNTFLSAGNFGIGAYPSVYKLDVNGLSRLKRTGVNGGGEGAVMVIESDAKTALDAVSIVFKANNSTNTETSYAGIAAFIDSPTAGAQSSYMVFNTYNAGAKIDALKLSKEGNAILHGTLELEPAVSGIQAARKDYVDASIAAAARLIENNTYTTTRTTAQMQTDYPDGTFPVPYVVFAPSTLPSPMTYVKCSGGRWIAYSGGLLP